MLQLLGAGIIRDGGSIAMEYRKKDGSLVSVLLEVNAYLDGETPTFGHLHVGSEIQSRCDASSIVAKGSAQEISLMNDVNELRRNAPPDARRESIHWLAQLQTLLPGRTG